MKKLFHKLVGSSVLFLAAFGTANAQDNTSPFGQPTAKVSYGNYLRFEVTGTDFRAGSGDWLPPGPADPRVFFDVTGESPFGGSLAYGFDWNDGRRAEAALVHIARQDIDAPSDSPTHADVTSSVSTTALMGNYYHSIGGGSFASPKLDTFVTAGIGLAFNSVGDWTRTNPTATHPVRVFEGDVTTSLAWSIGAGVSYDISQQGNRPIYLELNYRYYDFGTARGSSTIAPGSPGSGVPRDPFNFRNTNQSISIGIRIPLQRL